MLPDNLWRPNMQTSHRARGASVWVQKPWAKCFPGTGPHSSICAYALGKDATLLIHEATLEDGLEEEAVEKTHR